MLLADTRDRAPPATRRTASLTIAEFGSTEYTLRCQFGIDPFNPGAYRGDSQRRT